MRSSNYECMGTKPKEEKKVHNIQNADAYHTNLNEALTENCISITNKIWMIQIVLWYFEVAKIAKLFIPSSINAWLMLWHMKGVPCGLSCFDSFLNELSKGQLISEQICGVWNLRHRQFFSEIVWTLVRTLKYLYIKITFLFLKNTLKSRILL